MQLIDHALLYLSRGWSVIALKQKRPLYPYKQFRFHRPYEEFLRSRFAWAGVDGIGVIMGPASGGVCIRDFDTADGYGQWSALHPDLAKTLPTVKTKRGYHVWFRGKEGYRKYDDGEYIGNALHYVAVPPTIHPSGHVYEWIVPLPAGELPIVDAEKEGLFMGKTVKSRKTDKPARKAVATNDHDCELPARTAAFDTLPDDVQSAILSTLPTTQGQREDCIFRFARRIKGIMPASADMSSVKVFDTVCDYFHEWYVLARPVIGTKNWPVNLAAFRRAVKRVTAGGGADWKQIIAVAQSQFGEYANSLDRLRILCRVAQEFYGPGQTWFFSCRKAGKAIGVNYHNAADCFLRLSREGFIEVVERCFDHKARKAHVYRTIG